MKILILGGYGTFGGRLAHLLADRADLTLLIAGRSLSRAEAFCAGWQGAARVMPIRADRTDVAPVLASLRPDLVVDASGPFQAYGHVVPLACIAQGVDYLDLADGSAFVAGIGALDAAARAAGVFVLAGVSTCPVLTGAVVAEMAARMQVVEVWGGIAPSPRAGVGRNVVQAVLSYAGDELPGHGVALVTSRRFSIAPPGVLPLGQRRFSLVDVPDLRALPAAYPGLNVWFGAAPVPAVLHGVLSLFARLRHLLRLPPLTPLAGLAHRALTAARFGPDRGGMMVAGRGADGTTLSWHLIAEGASGPMIPSLAAEGVIRKLLAGQRPAPGARSGLGALSLADYDALFARHAITTGWRDNRPGPLYARVLGADFDLLPAPLRALHQPGTESHWTGRARIRRGKGVLAGPVARLFGFPAAGEDVPVSVRFRTDAQGVEEWQRNFGGRRMVSTQEEGHGPIAGLIVERFGPFAFALALLWQGDRLTLIPRHWRFFGLPLPRALGPFGETFEREADGRFTFHVEIALPLLGEIVRYEGWLNPACPSDTPPAPSHDHDPDRNPPSASR